MRPLPLALALFAAVPAAAAPLDERLAALAGQGDAEAAYHLGMLYNNGIGVAPDPAAAFRWFVRAAEGGDPLGAYKVGCYYDGQGEGVVKPDPAKALQYKLVAARAGYALAQHDVASHYHLLRREAGARQWLEAAAAQGDQMSLLALAQLDGKPDARQIYLTLGKIAKLAGGGEEQGAALLAQIGAQLAPAERRSADAAIAAYTPAPTPLTLKARAGLAVARTLAGLPSD